MKTELLAPAGDFQTGLHALSIGADAIYTGLQRFSARKAATNLTQDEYLRLKEFSLKKNKKVFITLNTLIPDEELDELYYTLAFLEETQTDAVIVQDPGLIPLIQNNFKNLPIHASTQMGIHNRAGVEVLSNLGIERAVLSRELSLQDIKKIHDAHPNMELEVFIHGALCYSFSGYCLASGLILGRSGNRGGCAQLCRSYYGHNDDYKFFFSCNDNHVGADILKLRAAGVSSFKIEGRMKEKEYVDKTIKLYRSILDTPTLDLKKIKSLEDEATLTFSRDKTKAFLFNPKGEKLIGNMNSGHQGIFLGEVQGISDRELQIKLEHPLKRNNSILFLKNGINKIRFCAFVLKNLKGKKIEEAGKGEEIIIVMNHNDLPEVGTRLHLIESLDESLNDFDHKNFPPYSRKVPIDLIITDSSLRFRSLDSDYSLDHTVETAVEESRSGHSFTLKFSELLCEHGESFEELIIQKIKNDSSHRAPFIPPSILKKVKNHLYEILKRNEFIKPVQEIAQLEVSRSWKDFFSIRKNLFVEENIPFLFTEDLPHLTLPKIEDTFVVPLLPILKNEESYFKRIAELVHTQKSEKFCFGINNIAHLKLVEELKDLPNVSFFLDFFTYLPNRHSLAFYMARIPNLKMAYAWVEGKTNPLSLTDVKDKTSLPLFLSLVCFKKHNEIESCEKCLPDRPFLASLVNGRKNYQVVTYRCLTHFYTGP